MKRWIIRTKDGEVESVKHNPAGTPYLNRRSWFERPTQCFFCTAEDELGAFAAWLRWKEEQDA
jgi:hypothetical protein